MFENALFESTTTTRTYNRWPAAFAIGLQSMLAVLLIALPLFHPERLLLTPQSISLAPPVMPHRHIELPKPKPVPEIDVTTTTPTAVFAPTPNTMAVSHSDPAPAEEATPPTGLNLNLAGSGTAISALPIGTGSGSPTIHVGSGTSGASNGSTAAFPTHGTTSISSGVSAGLLLSPIKPEYPMIAKVSHTQGTVLVQARISTTGTIEQVHAVSGPAMLYAAAEDAVRKARYRPFLLNHQPTEVEASFVIHFTLNE